MGGDDPSAPTKMKIAKESTLFDKCRETWNILQLTGSWLQYMDLRLGNIVQEVLTKSTCKVLRLLRDKIGPLGINDAFQDGESHSGFGATGRAKYLFD